MWMRFLKSLKRKRKRMEMRRIRIRRRVLALSRTVYPDSYPIEEKKTDDKEEDIPIQKEGEKKLLAIEAKENPKWNVSQPVLKGKTQ